MKILGYRIIKNDPAIRYPEDLEKKIKDLDKQIQNKNDQLKSKDEELKTFQQKISKVKAELIIEEDELLMQSFGLYKPLYDCAKSEEYKDLLKEVRNEQKQIIRDKKAITCSTNWTVEGSKRKGQKLTNDTIKLLLRAFNDECDTIISKVRYSNFEQSDKRIHKSYELINKLGASHALTMSRDYLNTKLRELRIVFEYAQLKQKEKEDLRLLREQQREEAKFKKEIEAERKRLAKEEAHYTKALADLLQQLEIVSDDLRAEVQEKIKATKLTLDDINKAIIDVDYREANQRAGYVYIISNIGSFGENIYKIGMSRRLKPEERIAELSDSSVPFNFDIHAMIFSDDAPKLEATLHRRFEDKKLNMVNTRREFFYANLNDIKQVIKDNYDKVVEFVDVPEAEQYRVSMRLRELNLANTQVRGEN